MGFLGLLGAGIGAAGSLFGGLFGGNASANASKQYIQALQQAQQYLSGELNQGTANYSPYLRLGSTAANDLRGRLSDLTAPWTQKFTAPTAAQAEQTPGYQFELQQGLNAAQNSAAGRGGLLSGGTLAGLNNYAQGVASTNYQNTFNNALTQYQSAYQSFLNNQNNAYSRLMGLSGQGLQAAGGAGNLISGIGGDIASLYGQQGAARAQGTIGQANAYGSILPGIGNSLLNYGLLSSLNGSQAMPSMPQGPTDVPMYGS